MPENEMPKALTGDYREMWGRATPSQRQIVLDAVQHQRWSNKERALQKHEWLLVRVFAAAVVLLILGVLFWAATLPEREVTGRRGGRAFSFHMPAF